MIIALKPAQRRHIAFLGHVARTVESPINHVVTEIEDIVTELLEKNVYRICVLEKRANKTVYVPVGFLTLEFQSPQAVYFAEVQILPNWQGRGIGEQVLRLAIDCLWIEAYSDLTIATHPTNAGARRLYTKCGFRFVRQDPDYRGMGPRDIFAQKLV